MVQLAHIFKKDKDKEKEREKDQPETKPPKPSKTSKASKPKASQEKDDSDSPGGSPRTSFSFSTRSPAKSPTKSSRSPTKSPTKPSSKGRFSHSRSSSTPASAAPPLKFGARSSKDQESHPLNLPPDELRRRLSAMAASRDEQRSSMDIDPQEPQQNNANGEERSPTPPPHRSSSNADEADSFKLAGNKFFKDGNYTRAIEEYNKGMFLLSLYRGSEIFFSGLYSHTIHSVLYFPFHSPSPLNPSLSP